LGTGGSGTVQLARRRDAADDGYYAVKVIAKSNLKACRSAREEGKLQRQLEHPGICPCVDVFEDDQNVYLVLEHVDGRDLFDEVEVKGQLEENYVAEIIRQLIKTLSYCHVTKNLIHRDLKPENIMLTGVRSGDLGPTNVHIKLIDFGLAQEATLDLAQPSVGTAAYLAPETAFGEYSPASDMWSVGKIICFMLFGGRGGHWDGVSSEARDFASRLLCENVTERLTAPQALCHPWLVKHTRRQKISGSVI
jgi:serine/threonine protein kinase